jgi:hypothetical protein
MKASKTILQAAVTLLTLGFLTESSHGQIYLTGLLQQGSDSRTGHSLDSPIFTTEGSGETSFAVIYLTQPNAGYTAPFLNPGTSATASISYGLTPGSYQFYFNTVSFFGNSPGPQNNPGTYGLNLFFGGDNAYPGIAAYSPANTITATAVQAGQPTLSLDGDGNNEVPAPGGLTYVADGLSVTLTGYGYGGPGAIGGPAVDRVGNLDSQPDGYADAIGVFDLTVSTVPEPSTIFLLAIGIAAALSWRCDLASKKSQRICGQATRESNAVFTGSSLKGPCAS